MGKNRWGKIVKAASRTLPFLSLCVDGCAESQMRFFWGPHWRLKVYPIEALARNRLSEWNSTLF
jgi:hypothetical protein